MEDPFTQLKGKNKFLVTVRNVRTVDSHTLIMRNFPDKKFGLYSKILLDINKL